MNTLNYEVDDTIQNKVVELAKEKLVWLENFKNKNGGIDKDLDEEIQFQMEEMRDWVNDYSNRRINVKCCQRAVKELSENLYYDMISHIMGKTFRVALANKVNKEEYMKHGYDVNASCPYFTPCSLSNEFDFSFSERSVIGFVYYVEYTIENGQLANINEEAEKKVTLSIDELKHWNGKRWRALHPILEDERICFIIYKKDEKLWNQVYDMICDIDEDKAIEKLTSYLVSLKEGKYKVCVFHKGDVLYIYFNDKFNKFVLESNDHHKEIGNRLINKIKGVMLQ